MKTTFKVAAVCAALFATSSFADTTLQNISKSGELRVCFDAGYMPFEMKAKNGEFIGFDVDLGKMLAKAIDVKFTPVNTSWDGIIPALLTNKCDVIMGGMTITAKRNMQVNFTEPYVVIGQSILLSDKLKDEVKSYRDLNDPKYTIATKIGTTGIVAAEKFLPKAKQNQFETTADAALEVSGGKADAFVYDLPFNAIYTAQHEGKVVHLDTPFTFEPLGFAVRQGDPDFLNFLNNYLKQIKGDGTYDRIYDKWFKSASWLDKVQ